jgi:haloalkane dehalogenase
VTIPFDPSPALYPFEPRWFETSAGRIHFVDEGEGRPILMLHGNPTWSFLWRNVILELRDRFRCVAPDYLGFGLSDRPADYGYTAAEHARVIEELVRTLDLDDFVVLGHDWGGPIGLAVANALSDRVGGLALGNTWFWPPHRQMRIFSRVMSSRPLQRAIIERNFFVERLIPAGTARMLTDEEMDHYRLAQPTPADRRGVAVFPREIIAARPLLERLWREVPERLGSKPVVVVWPMRDLAFRPRPMLPRFREAFRDMTLVEVARAKHYIAEDAPAELARAVIERFG